MPLNKITISETFHLGDNNYFKVGQEGTIVEGETREQLAEDAMKFIYGALAKYHPMYAPSIIKNESGEMPVIDINDR